MIPAERYVVPSQPAASRPILQAAGLTKVFGNRLVVNGLNLRVDRGEIFGLLGPAGAGKTTTIRMLVGLVRPTSGEVRLFGEELRRRGSAARLLPRVGALIDRPAFEPFLSGRDNLLAVGGYTGGTSPRRVDDLLELLDLSRRAGERYSTYLPGMRQRLGMAAALLNDPELLILDEPATGLDPVAALEQQDLFHRLQNLGKTLFIASHSLAEIRNICTRIGIMRSGQLVMVGGVDELLRATSRWEISCDHPEQVRDLLAAGLPGIISIHVRQGLVTVEAPEVRGRDIVSCLAGHGIFPDGVRLSEEDLQHIFLRLTEREVGL
jgi:ABC-2 type transport system ATP-binding protein